MVLVKYYILVGVQVYTTLKDIVTCDKNIRFLFINLVLILLYF